MPAKSLKPGKTIEQRRERVARILPILKQTYPDSHCSLTHTNPFELLIATILSAQCTDERVNMVTPALFKKYPTPGHLAKVPQEQLEKDIQSTGFYRNKAKSLKGMAQALIDEHNGNVPASMDDLTDLPGVGRKTANVILGNAFRQNIGIVVDTHVGRLSHRLGLTKHTDPVKIEQDLMQIVPQDDWCLFSHLLIDHGRAICQARTPKCQICPLLPYCPAGQKLVKSVTKKP
jgi:endonuclease III